VSEHKLKDLKEPSSNPHPRQVPNQFKMSKLGPKNFFKKKRKPPNTRLEGIFPWQGYTPPSLEV
jgi:hypothetical protein